MDGFAEGAFGECTTPTRSGSGEEVLWRDNNKLAGGDALTGHTRSHPEHDG